MSESGYQVFGDAISAYRDIEIAKRNQPKLVQGLQTVQVPLARNASAEVQDGDKGALSVSSVIKNSNKPVIYMGLGLLAIAGYLSFRKR